MPTWDLLNLGVILVGAWMLIIAGGRQRQTPAHFEKYTPCLESIGRKMEQPLVLPLVVCLIQR